jgi:hypothetical protein
MLLCALALAGYAKKPESIRYDIECAGNGVQGTYLVKVWVYGEPKKITADVMKKYAVHGVLFKGFAGKDGCVSQSPLVGNAAVEQEKAEFFTAFFNQNMEYIKYVTEVNGTAERVKVGKEYKIGIVASVAKDQLRKDLETAGVIRALSDGF